MSEIQPLIFAIDSIHEGKTLSADVIAAAFRVIMYGNATDGMIGAFLSMLACRVPTGDELYGASIVMKECVERVKLPNPDTLLDTCGTGGAPKTFNVSTAAGIVAAACGARVAKHGNRSRTGRGSAEILEQLGINIETTIDQQVACLEQVGICFCFAPTHHKAVAHVMPVRKELPFPTIFNLLGPLTNPCSAGRQLLGVWSNQYVMPMAEALQQNGTIRSAVVHSHDGLDEISISAPTRIVYINQNSITEDVLVPEELGLQCSDLESVTAHDLPEATVFMRECLIEGKRGAPRDMVLLNSGVSLLVAGLVETVEEGITKSSTAIDSGHVEAVLQRWVEVSNTHISSTEQ